MAPRRSAGDSANWLLLIETPLTFAFWSASVAGRWKLSE